MNCDNLNLPKDLVSYIRNGDLSRLNQPYEYIEYFRVFEPDKYPRFKAFDDFMASVKDFYFTYGMPEYDLMLIAYKQYARECGAFNMWFTWQYVRNMWDLMMYENSKRALARVNELGIWELCLQTASDVYHHIIPALIPIHACYADSCYWEAIHTGLLNAHRWIVDRDWLEKKEWVLSVVASYGEQLIEAHLKNKDAYYQVVRTIFDVLNTPKYIVYTDTISFACEWYIQANLRPQPSTRQLSLFA